MWVHWYFAKAKLSGLSRFATIAEFHFSPNWIYQTCGSIACSLSDVALFLDGRCLNWRRMLGAPETGTIKDLIIWPDTLPLSTDISDYFFRCTSSKVTCTSTAAWSIWRRNWSCYYLLRGVPDHLHITVSKYAFILCCTHLGNCATVPDTFWPMIRVQNLLSQCIYEIKIL